jgi:hypothetical protein
VTLPASWYLWRRNSSSIFTAKKKEFFVLCKNIAANAKVSESWVRFDKTEGRPKSNEQTLCLCLLPTPQNFYPKKSPKNFLTPSESRLATLSSSQLRLTLLKPFSLPKLIDCFSVGS